MDRLAALPGVQSVGIVDNVPLNEGLVGRALPSRASARRSADEGTLLGFTSTAGNYFATMGIELLAGRAFTEADQLSELGNVVVSRSAANLLWPGQDPIGRRLQREDIKTWETVVGVVEDVMQDDFRDPPAAGGLLSAGRPAAGGMDGLVPGVRGEDAARGNHRTRDPRARSAGGARRADVPRSSPWTAWRRTR